MSIRTIDIDTLSWKNPLIKVSVAISSLLGRQPLSSNCKVSVLTTIGVEPIMSLSVFTAGSEIGVDNVEEDLFDFDEGDDLECDLAAALLSDDRKAADKNCLKFDEHVA